jgi:hypothetical protein
MCGKEKESTTMARKQRPPYFRVAFPGPVKTVSEGTWDGGWKRRTYIDLGEYRLRDVVTDMRMDSALDEAADDPGSVVGLGHFLVWRWVLSVSRDGRTERQGLMRFILSILAATAAFAASGLVCLSIAIGAVDAVDSGRLRELLQLSGIALPGLVLPLLWAAHMVMNFKAWCGARASRK